jgi:hypothetical protein
MITVAGGDSHIWGSELSDSPHGGPTGYSRKTFAALLSTEHYTCAAYPGIGNIEIARRIQEACELIQTKKQVIVCWTWASRDNAIDSDQLILNLQNYLIQNNIPYLFTCVDNCIITDNPEINWDRWYMFPPGTAADETHTPRGFYQWAVENKYTVGSEHHPLEDAHRDAAELIRSKFNELVEKFNQQNQIRNSLS